jgi:CubicO group peptidase (beta-lactamase class C family)
MIKKKVYKDVEMVAGGIYKLLKGIFLAGITFYYFAGLCGTSDTISVNGNTLELEQLENMVEKIENENLGINSVIIVKNNQLVFERYFNENEKDNLQLTYHIINSVISTLIGICIDCGLIENVNQKVITFFPEYKEKITDSLQYKITIEHLLTMTGGYEWESEHHNNEIKEFVENPDLLEYMFSCSIANDPGTAFSQNSGGIFLLAKIIEKATSTTIEKFADEKLFKPLEIHNYKWERDSTGKTKGAYALHMSPRDLAKFGCLYLNEGVWDDKEIVKREWIKKSTELHLALSPIAPISLEIEQNGMGYLWWNFSGMYAAQGHSGQKLFVIPSKNTVVVITANTPFYIPTRLYLDFIRDAI